MDYRKLCLKIAGKKIGKEDGLRFKSYFIEYARWAAQRAGIDDGAAKRTNILCTKYPLFRDLFVIAEVIYNQAVNLTAKGVVCLTDEEKKVLKDWIAEALLCMKKGEADDANDVADATDLFPDK